MLVRHFGVSWRICIVCAVNMFSVFCFFSVLFYFFPPLAYDYENLSDAKHRKNKWWPNNMHKITAGAWAPRTNFTHSAKQFNIVALPQAHMLK